MAFIFDHLQATIIGMTVMLMLFAAHRQMMDLNVQRTITYMMKTHSLSFADWLEDDLLTIGENMPTDKIPFENPNTSGGLTTDYRFYKDSLAFGTSTVDTFRIETWYKLDKAATRVIDGESVDLYRLERRNRVKLSGSTYSSWKVTGSSPGLLKHFEVKMLNRDGIEVTNPATAAAAVPDTVQQTHANFALVAPMPVDEKYLNVMHWGANILLRQ